MGCLPFHLNILAISQEQAQRHNEQSWCPGQTVQESWGLILGVGRGYKVLPMPATPKQSLPGLLLLHALLTPAAARDCCGVFGEGQLLLSGCVLQGWGAILASLLNYHLWWVPLLPALSYVTELRCRRDWGLENLAPAVVIDTLHNYFKRCPFWSTSAAVVIFHIAPMFVQLFLLKGYFCVLFTCGQKYCLTA